ncbi:hypothetical protein GGX14DRAFT_546917 [Mycena pura]|uniref:FAR-17a/AIG1-like protein n=1 Tax=Mycena pura TaxID=153505 RepID=A0AAD6XWB9_9AGAR|nr:hypothetical protein GGX14DRAFT_546917 [Mycena pura]
MTLFSSAHFGAAPPFDPQHKFITSWLVSPAALASIRTLLALYALFSICTSLGFTVSSGDGASFLSFFTQLSYIGLTAYYCAAAVQTVAYARWGRYPLRRWPRTLQALHVVLQSTMCTFPFIVTVVYWGLLSSNSFDSIYDSWSNITLHAMNSAFALFELLLTNAPPAPWLALPIHIALLGGYLGVAYITHATQGFYTYAFLDPANGGSGALLAAYIVGIGAGACAVFLLARGAVVLRQRAAVRAGNLELAPDVRDDPDDSEWVEVERPGPAARPKGGTRHTADGEKGAAPAPAHAQAV